MEAALNWYAEEHLPEGSGSWTVTTSSGNDVNDLIHNLQEGNPTVIYGAWEQGGVPHTVVIAGYDPAGDNWQILDPAAGPNPQVSEWSTEFLESWWGRKYSAYPRYTMVVLDVEGPSPIQPVPEPPPTPPPATEPPPTLTPVPPQSGTPSPYQAGSP
jgi:hypothetical protein